MLKTGVSVSSEGGENDVGLRSGLETEKVVAVCMHPPTPQFSTFRLFCRTAEKLNAMFITIQASGTPLFLGFSTEA